MQTRAAFSPQQFHQEAPRALRQHLQSQPRLFLGAAGKTLPAPSDRNASEEKQCHGFTKKDEHGHVASHSRHCDIASCPTRGSGLDNQGISEPSPCVMRNVLFIFFVLACVGGPQVASYWLARYHEQAKMLAGGPAFPEPTPENQGAVLYRNHIHREQSGLTLATGH